MVTNPEPEPAGPSPVETGIRGVIAGHPQGAVRRIVLYLTVAVALIVGVEYWVAIPGIIALILLAVTDNLA